MNEKLFRSCIHTTSSIHKTEDVLEWVKKRNKEVVVSVKEIRFSELNQWFTDDKTGNIHHKTGKFFTIEGVEINTNSGLRREWSQPIIHQPEVGYLGFLVKEIDGVLHFLVQAKIEPGNVNNIQLSPTIQATRSNFTRVHQGKTPTYLEYFVERRGTVLLDQLQSEQGSRFFRKRNRNIILQIEENIPEHEDFRWLTLGQIKQLLKHDNLVNMDTRTVISGITYGNQTLVQFESSNQFHSSELSEVGSMFLKSYLISDSSKFSTSELLSWLTELKSSYELDVKLIPLNEVQNWKRDEFRVYHESGKYFEVIAVDVEILNREVAKWSQPIIKPCTEGIVAFIAKRINGVLHFLVQAKLEVGNLDIVELAPTVQCITGNYRTGEKEYEVPYLEEVLKTKPQQILYDTLLSEEGGRFFKNQNRNMLILAEDNFEESTPANYNWFTLNQLMQFMQFNNYVNIEARSLLSVISFN